MTKTIRIAIDCGEKYCEKCHGSDGDGYCLIFNKFLMIEVEESHQWADTRCPECLAAEQKERDGD